VNLGGYFLSDGYNSRRKARIVLSGAAGKTAKGGCWPRPRRAPSERCEAEDNEVSKDTSKLRVVVGEDEPAIASHVTQDEELEAQYRKSSGRQSIHDIHFTFY
jgi:hypothetical protein